jgi:hypothetical protein
MYPRLFKNTMGINYPPLQKKVHFHVTSTDSSPSRFISPLSYAIPVTFWAKPTLGEKVHHTGKASPSAGARIGQSLQGKLANPVTYGESQKLH